MGQQLKPSRLWQNCRPPTAFNLKHKRHLWQDQWKTAGGKGPKKTQTGFSHIDHFSFPFPPPSFWSTTALKNRRPSPSKRQHRHNGRNVENIHSCLSLLPFSGSTTWFKLIVNCAENHKRYLNLLCKESKHQVWQLKWYTGVCLWLGFHAGSQVKHPVSTWQMWLQLEHQDAG